MTDDKSDGYFDHYMSVTMNRLDNRSIKRNEFDFFLLSKSMPTYKRPDMSSLVNSAGTDDYKQRLDEYMQRRAKEKREERKRNELPYKLFPCLMVTREVPK